MSCSEFSPTPEMEQKRIDLDARLAEEHVETTWWPIDSDRKWWYNCPFDVVMDCETQTVTTQTVTAQQLADTVLQGKNATPGRPEACKEQGCPDRVALMLHPITEQNNPFEGHMILYHNFECETHGTWEDTPYAVHVEPVLSVSITGGSAGNLYSFEK